MAIDITAAIVRFAGRRDRFLANFQEAADSAPQIFSLIIEEIDAGRLGEAAQIAHALKSRVGAVGMVSLSERLQDLETALRRKQPLELLIAEIGTEIRAAQSEIQLLGIDCRQIEWQNAYATGIPAIDAQHQALLKIINKLAKPVGISADQLHEVLAELSDYAVTHFDFEEGYMQSAGYHDITGHMQEHTDFVGEISLRSLDAMYGRSDPEEVFGFLTQWWINHVLVTDREMRDTAHPLTSR